MTTIHRLGPAAFCGPFAAWVESPHGNERRRPRLCVKRIPAAGDVGSYQTSLPLGFGDEVRNKAAADLARRIVAEDGETLSAMLEVEAAGALAAAIELFEKPATAGR